MTLDEIMDQEIVNNTHFNSLVGCRVFEEFKHRARRVAERHNGEQCILIVKILQEMANNNDQIPKNIKDIVMAASKVKENL